MASTFTTRLRLEKQTAGENLGIWGDVANLNFGELLEAALAGVLVITHNDGTYTLTASNGAIDEARYAVLKITGAITAARDVVAPGVQKLYIVHNATSGAFDVTVRTATGAGVAVSTGQTRLVYCDGLDFSAVSVGGTNFSFSATPPLSPLIGDRWFNAAAGILFTWVNDGTSTQWAQL